MTGGPGKEHGTNKTPSNRRIWKRSKGDRRCQSIGPTNLSESSLKSILAEQCVLPGRTPSQNDWSETNLRTNPIPRKPKAVSHMAEQVSWFPLPSCSLPGWTLPSQWSLWLCTMCISLDNSFLSPRQEPSLRPWKGSSFLQQYELLF